MYSDIEKIVIELDLYGKIEFDNVKKCIIYNDKMLYEGYDDYLNRLFRIIRLWDNTNKKDYYVAKIKIISSSYNCEYNIIDSLPSNYNSFIDLVFEIIN